MTQSIHTRAGELSRRTVLDYVQATRVLQTIDADDETIDEIYREVLKIHGWRGSSRKDLHHLMVYFSEVVGIRSTIQRRIAARRRSLASIFPSRELRSAISWAAFEARMGSRV